MKFTSLKRILTAGDITSIAPIVVQCERVLRPIERRMQVFIDRQRAFGGDGDPSVLEVITLIQAVQDLRYALNELWEKYPEHKANPRLVYRK